MNAATLMSLLVKIGVDSSAFSKGLQDTESKTNSFGSKVTKTLGGIGGMIGTGIAAGVAVATAAVGAGMAALASTIQPASDLAETTSKIGVVFAEQAADVLEFGKTSAQALGMSTNAALSAAGTYGNLFRSMGITSKTSADMSMNLVKVAADLASFNNMDPTQVLDSLRAGLSGETEPLKKLGVNINQATLEAKALEMGLWNGKGALDASAKAQASYALILEQTSLAQGDFARTSDGLANQQRILSASVENIKAAIGTGMLPVIQGVVGGLTGYMGRISNILNASMSLDQKIWMIQNVLKDAAGGFTKILPDILNAGVKVVGALVEGIVGSIPNIMPAMVELIGTMTTFIINLAPLMVEAGVSIIKALIKGLIASLPVIMPAIANLMITVVNAMRDILPKLVGVGIAIVVSLMGAIGGALPTMIPTIVGMLQTIVMIIIQQLPLLIEAGIGIIAGLINGLLVALPNLIAWMPYLLTAMVTAITTALPMLLNAAVAIVTGLINGIVGALPLILDQLPVIVTTIVTVIMDNLPLVISAAISILTAVVTGLLSAIPQLVEAVPQLIDALIKAFTASWPDLKKAGLDLWNQLKESEADLKAIAKQLMTGFWEGLKSKMDEIWDNVGKWITGLIDKLKGLLGIKSPSTVFYGIGKNMMLGLEKGITQNAYSPEVAVDGATANISAIIPPSNAGDNNGELLFALSKIPTAQDIARAVRDAVLLASA